MRAWPDNVLVVAPEYDAEAVRGAGGAAVLWNTLEAVRALARARREIAGFDVREGVRGLRDVS